MDRIVMVTKPTRLKELVLKYHTEGAAQFVLESQGQSIKPYEDEDTAYTDALIEIRRQIPNDIPVASVKREDLPNFLFRDNDLILVCGPDGLFANTAKYIGNQPVLTVTPGAQRTDSALMLFLPGEVGKVLAQVQAGEYRTEKLPFVKASIDNNRVVWGINDIFIGRKDHVSARYEVSFNGTREHQSSSGIIVSTGVGSTGWIRAVTAMMDGLTNARGGNKLSLLPSPTSNELVFVVREPFPSANSKANVVTGRIVPNSPLVVSSEMPNGGYIFSDGVVEKAIEWNVGSEVIVTVGDRYVQRIIR